MHDLVITGGHVVDGTGAVRRRADLAVDGGRITAVGTDLGPATRTIDADGRIVAPGFVDVHTHLDVQGFWDPTLSPSPLHGVTTVLGGNCGFTVAPLGGDAGEYLMRMLARVEGMPLEALETGVPWDWTSTAEYLDRLDGTLALNAGFMVGHSAIRRVVMADAATERAATVDELSQMAGLLRAGLAAGALGFSSTWSNTHNDADGQPVPSRWATAEELVTLATVCGEFEGTSLEFLPGVGRWDAETRQVMLDMTVAAQRPLNWNIITGSARSLAHWQEKLALGDEARAVGGKIIGLVIPKIFGARFCFRSGFVLDAIDGWREPMALPPGRQARHALRPRRPRHAGGSVRRTTRMGGAHRLGRQGHRRDVQRRHEALRGPARRPTSPPRRPRRRSMPCWTSSSPTTCARLSATPPTTTPTPTGRPAPSCGATPVPSSAPRTPAPTSTCWPRSASAPTCSASASGSTGCSPPRRRSGCSRRCQPTSTACATAAGSARARAPTSSSSTRPPSAPRTSSPASTSPAVPDGSTPEPTASTTCS